MKFNPDAITGCGSALVATAVGAAGLGLGFGLGLITA